MSMVSKKISKPKVTVFSDYICPFCFIGKSSIDRLQKEFEVEVEWKNIEIHPETPLNGVPLAQIDSSFFSQMWLNVERLAKESGIEIRPPTVMANSSLAMIAVEYARKENLFEAFHDAVFRAYWQEGKNIGDIKVLLEVAKTIGLDPLGLNTYFKENAIEKHSRSALDHPVSGVPTFVIGDETVVGAQPYKVIRETFSKAGHSLKPKVEEVNEIHQATGEISEDTCTMDSKIHRIPRGEIDE